MAKRTSKNLPQPLFDKTPYPSHLSALAAKHLQATYSFERLISEGKTGATYCLKHRDTGQLYCLKTIKSGILDPAQRRSVSDTLKKEGEILQPLHHRCLPTIFQTGKHLDQQFYVCSYHPGSTFAALAKNKKKFGKLESVFVIRSLMDVLKYLHSKGRQHNDLHANNVMLGEAVYEHGVMVIDFGSGHRLSDPSARTAMRGNVYLKPESQKARQNQSVLRQDENFEVADFRALGELLLEMGEVFYADANALYREAYSDFARALFNRQLKTWADAESAFDAVIDPLRLISSNTDLFMSSEGMPQDIPLPVTASAPVGRPSLAVINTDSFQRLRNVRQLSFCDLYFPGAVHTRFEHSLGVFANAKRAVDHLAHNRKFRELVTPLQARGLLLAALIHDVGHYPFAHVIEQYATSRLWKHPQAKDAARHETRSLEILRTDSEFRKAVVENWGSDACSIAEGLMSRDGGNLLLKSILDGPVDVDKLDYLRRDAHHCGVNFGAAVDIDEVLRSLTVVRAREAVGITDAGISCVEGLMILQDQMLASVYWHPIARGAICMLHALFAHVVGDDPARFGALVSKIKTCHTETAAVENAITPACKAAAARLAPTRDGDAERLEQRLLELVGFVVQPDFRSVYQPIAEYPRTERVEKEPTSIYLSLVSDKTLTGAGELPVNWPQVKRLREAYLFTLQQRKIEADQMDIVIDVPYGKPARAMLKVVVSSTGDEEDITAVSNLPASIFAAPAAFAAPVRVYVSPKIYRGLNAPERESVRQTAKDRFFDRRWPQD